MVFESRIEILVIVFAIVFFILGLVAYFLPSIGIDLENIGGGIFRPGGYCVRSATCSGTKGVVKYCVCYRTAQGKIYCMGMIPPECRH